MTDKIFYSPLTGKPLHRMPDDATIPAGTPYGYETTGVGFIWAGTFPGPLPPERRVSLYTYWTEEPMTYIKPELIEKAASAVRQERTYIDATAFGVPLDNVGESASMIARAALFAVADDLRDEGAVQALREAAAEMERDEEWGFTGHAVPAWLRARADRKESYDE